MGLAIAGCGESHELGTDGGATDAPPDVVIADAGPDALECPEIWPPATPECCEAEAGGYWDEASGECWVAVPGPFIPPSMTA